MAWIEIVDKLPEQKCVIGTTEVIKAAKSGKVKLIIAADNCPQFLKDKVTSSEIGGNVEMKRFTGDQADLGTRLGKPFPVAIVGY